MFNATINKDATTLIVVDADIPPLWDSHTTFLADGRFVLYKAAYAVSWLQTIVCQFAGYRRTKL